MRPPSLTLVPKPRSRSRGLQDGDLPIAYDVAGLPPDLAIEIAEIDGRWQLMVVRDGDASDWQGDFDSADQALAAVVRELTPFDLRSPH
jgi:hypothetical protein